MRPSSPPVWIFIVGILFLVLAVVLIIADTPMEPETDTAPEVEIRHEQPPYPEEDTMHYLTEEGVLIVYAP